MPLDAVLDPCMLWGMTNTTHPERAIGYTLDFFAEQMRLLSIPERRKKDRQESVALAAERALSWGWLFE